MKPGEIKIKNTEIEINQGHFETVINVKILEIVQFKLVHIFISLKPIKV